MAKADVLMWGPTTAYSVYGHGEVWFNGQGRGRDGVTIMEVVKFGEILR